MGRLDDRIAVAAEIAVALVIGDDDDDVGFLTKSQRRGEGEQKSGETHKDDGLIIEK